MFLLILYWRLVSRGVALLRFHKNYGDDELHPYNTLPETNWASRTFQKVNDPISIIHFQVQTFLFVSGRLRRNPKRSTFICDSRRHPGPRCKRCGGAEISKATKPWWKDQAQPVGSCPSWRKNGCVMVWLIGLIDLIWFDWWMHGWCGWIDWLVDCLIDSSIYWLIRSLIAWSICLFLRL